MILAVSVCNGSLSLLLNPLTAECALRALVDSTLSNARRFYSSMGNPLDGKGLSSAQSCENHKQSSLLNISLS